jgi:glycosyltransferase involved in cell wall biosynthesis
MNKKLIRITTVPMSFKYLLKGQMSFMSENGFDVIMISSDGQEVNDVIKNEKCDHIIIPLTRKITILKDLKATYNLYKLIRKEKPDIVHTHTPKAGIVGMLASYFAKASIRLHTVAGLPLIEASGFKRIVLNFVEKVTYSCATNVYPNSNGLKNIILDNGFAKKEKLKVIANGSSNGIDTSYFNPQLFEAEEKKALKDKLNIKESDFVFIFVGRIVGDKGINELVAAFDKLSKENEKIKLLLVGPFEADLDPLKKKTSVIINDNKQIIYVGFQKDVRPYFSIANLLTFPSYREGFPNVVMQAGAMGLPSIVTNINGCNEIMEHGENGWIIPVKDEEAILDCMQNCLINTEGLNRMSKNARKLILNRYEQKVVWEAILNEYKTLERNV